MHDFLGSLQIEICRPVSPGPFIKTDLYIQLIVNCIRDEAIEIGCSFILDFSD